MGLASGSLSTLALGPPKRLLEGLGHHRFMNANADNALEAARWRTPYQVICDAWTKDP